MINRYHGTITLISELKTKIALEGELCACLETNTTYKYLTAGSSYTADDKYVLTTGNGGNTRWVGIAGLYGIYGSATDYTKFEADGTMVAVGDAICYRDEYVGGSWFVPGGASAPDVVDVTIGGVVTRKYAFDGSGTTEKLGNTFEIPHDIAITQVNAGTLPIEAHIHSAPSGTGSGTARFTFDWCLIKVNGAPIAGTQVVLSQVIAGSQQYHNLLVGGNLAVPSGGFTIGDLIEFTLTRDPSNAGDTYASDQLLYQVAMHVPVDTLGSRTTYTK